ncbi:cadherin domain-containing protein [Ditylenchus destructor]|uniref:Cadherin domain-containing protein n=1 Tax=Ditylenchus destructor TaxID=166010 RepID=A0AAD4R9U7_9BILA|nr:cadherin domain-containing protein [Ditylenchus destructor]
MFKILSFLVLLFLRYCTGEENTNGVRNVSIQSAAEAALHKALGELRSKADVNAVLEPASIPISEGPSHYHVTTQSNIDDVPSTTISMLEMDAVQPGQIQTAAKFDFVPHFEDTTFEFMMSEGVNKVDNVAAIVSFYGLLDGSVPEFSIKFDRLNYFAIGEISMQQESNYLLCFVPIVLRGGVTVALADANNGIYKFKIQATQGEHQSESTVKVEIAKFQPAPINNSSVDSVELLASSVSSADLAELAKAPPSSEDGVTEGADLVLGSGSLATDFPSENAAIPSEEESNSNMDTMVDPEFPAGDGAEIPDDTAMMSDPLSDETTATVGVPLSIKNNTVNNDNQVALLKESMTKGVTNNSEMGGERKESENMSMSHPDSVNTFDVETTEEPQEELPVEDAENTKADEGNSGIQEENMPVLSPSSNNTLEVDTKIQPHEGTMLGENGEANSENNEMSDNSMSGNDMMEGNNGDTNDDMMPKEESQQETSGNVEQELENGATTIETGETAAPPAVDKIDQGTNENNIDRNQENTVDFKRTNLNDIVQIQVTGLQKDSTIRLSGNLPAEKILPNLEVKVTVNDTQAIDEVIQLWIEPNTILDIKPHFVMPGDTVKFVTVHTNFTVDSNERGEIISLKARFANHKVHERLGAFAETKLFVKSDAKARLSEKMKFDKVMYEFGISEWAKTGTKIGLIQIDAQSKPMVIKYSVFGRDSQKFTIDNDGILYVNCNGASTCLDRETTPMYQFAVIATDSENGQSSPPALVSIVVDDENDNGPLLKLYDNEVVITSGEILTPFLISTIDYDTEVNENNELELGGEAATFLVVEKLSTGLWQLRVKSYTEPGEYQLNISAIDMSGKNPSDNTIVKVIVIEPESPIRFRRNVYERAISSEKVVKGVPIAQLDLEGISVDAVTFVILENPGWLAIESFGGNIFVGDVPRKGIESGQYIATVAAVDRESQKILAKCQVNIAVENFHEPYRTFLRPFYSVVISPENVTDPYVVELFDRSLSGNVHIVINENKAWAQDDRLVDMNDNSTIWIMENQLLINVEKLGDIRLVYLVLSNGEHNATVSILVRSDPEKELMEIYATSKPRFIDPWISEKIPIKLQILEELPSGYTLVHIPAYNPMDMKAISNFSLAGKDAHYFRVDSSTGNIYLQKSIDFEAVSESSTSPVILEFQLHAFNQIELLNIDDATPTLDIIGSNIVEIPENSPIGTLVAQLSCQDRDSQRLNLQLSGKESENFHLRQKDNRYLLEVSSPSSLDRERIDRMSLIVTCTDPAGNFVQLPIVIRVLDENDNRPLFISPTSTKDIKVYNNWPAGVALLRFQAVDKDLGSNARIIYTIKDDNKIAKYLSVDAATGILSTNVSLSSADTSQPYTITVLASDDHVTPKFTSTTTVLVRVLEAASSSENALRIIQPAIDYVLEIPEDVPMGRKIFDVVAISGSENENNLADGMLKYYLEPIDVSDRGWLRINEETGEVFTAAQFDFEQQEFVTPSSIRYRCEMEGGAIFFLSAPTIFFHLCAISLEISLTQLNVLVTIYAMVFPDSILRHFRTRLSRRKRSSSVDVLEDVSDSEERNKIAMEKRKRSSSLRSRRSLRRLRNGGKFEATNNITSPPERDYIVSQQIEVPFNEKGPQHVPVTDIWSARFRELQKSLRSSKKNRHKQHVPLSRQQSLIVSEDLAHTEPPYHIATYRNSIRAASADDILDAGGNAYDHQQSMLNYSTHFPVNEYPAVAVSVSGQLRDPYGGYVFPHIYGYGDEEKANMWNAEPTDTSTSALGEGYSHTTESGYGSTRGAVPSSMTEIGGKIQQSSPRTSETAFTEGSGSYYQYSPTTRTLLKIRKASPPSRSQQEVKVSPARSGTSRRAQSPRAVVMPQFSLGMLSPKSLQTLSRPPGSGELARNQPRYGRTRTDIGMRQLARSEQDLGFRRRRLSSTQTAKAIQAIEFLKSRIRETKYVTAVFESHKGGLRSVIDDVTREFAHWLGPKSRLLAVACEVHWSVPEKVRSRAMEIEMKDCLHRALRDNNQRVLNIYEEIRRDLPLSFIESKTEESCGKESRVDAFQGIYRRYYPEMLELQDPVTINSHKSYWTLDNLKNGNKALLKPAPAKFLHRHSISQLARKSVVAINMATLRLEGDQRDYDRDSVRNQEMKIVVKNGMTNSNGTGLLRVKLLNMDDNESRFLEKSQGNTVIISEGTDLEEERSIGNISAFDEDGDRIFYHTLPHCSKHDGRYRIDKRSGEIFVTPIGIKNAAPSQLCILASPSSDFDPSLKQEYNSSADNQLGIKIYQAERRNVFEQLLKLVKEFGNNSVINLAPNSESTILSSSNFANRPPNFFSFKLKELEFVPYSQKSIDSKKILIATPIDLIDVDSSSGDLRIDPKIYSMDEGIYIVKIDVNFKKVSYDTLLTKQIHVLSSENRLKFVFDEPVNSMALNLQLFKNKTEETISSVNPGIQLIIMQPQIYSSRSNRSSVCFHLANASMPSFSTILPVNDTIHMVSTASNFNPFLDSTYKSFKVVNIEPCLASTNDESIITDSFNTYSSSFSNIKLSRELLLLICLVASSILILTALCGYTCFVARYRVYLERQSTKGPSTESSYSNGKTRPANSPFAVPQFIDARKM